MKAFRVFISFSLLPVLAALAVSCGGDRLVTGLLGGKLFQPSRPFSEMEPPPAPDYSEPESWGCLPDREGDPCDQVPKNSGLVDGQATAKVDCFMVYPTTFYGNYGWNARIDDRLVKRITDRGPLRLYFSVYNGSCRVFAPYFRQACIGALERPTGDPDQVAAMNLAREDVLRAFQYYLDHFDRGYPIIIGGHSQGVRYAISILQEYFEGTPMEARLVAGYLIGGSLNHRSFERLPVCGSPTETQCVLGWRTVEWGARTNDMIDVCTDCEENGYIWECVNPLSWRRDQEWVEASYNLGGVPSGFDRLDPEITGAKCEGGSLWVKPAKTRGYRALGGTNYHLCDYTFFYMNIRANVDQRIKAFNGG